MKETIVYPNSVTVRLVRLAMFIALSAVGSFIKVPSPTGTVALDSAPGYLGALAFGPKEGAMIAAFGHLFSAGLVGFPLTLPIHLFVAAQMAVFASIFAYAYQRFNIVLASILAILLNGVVAPALFILIPGYGLAFFTMMIVPLLIGSAINIIVTALVFHALKRTRVFPESIT